MQLIYRMRRTRGVAVLVVVVMWGRLQVGNNGKDARGGVFSGKLLYASQGCGKHFPLGACRVRSTHLLPPHPTPKSSLPATLWHTHICEGGLSTPRHSWGISLMRSTWKFVELFLFQLHPHSGNGRWMVMKTIIIINTMTGRV